MKPTLKHVQSEDSLQQACITWFRLQFHSLYWNLFAIPNGGHRSKITASILKGTGVLSGAWDLFLSVPKNGYHGMYIEMKVGKNRLTENQMEFQDANCEHYHFEVCYSLDEFIEAVMKYLN